MGQPRPYSKKIEARPRGSRSSAALPTPRGLIPQTVPTRWVKMVAGVLLLPVSWILSRTFFEEFTRATVTHNFWRTEEFYFFMLGAVVWLIAFAGLPRPLLVYVFGHELTHALWVWALGGEVMAFKVHRGGGYIIADRPLWSSRLVLPADLALPPLPVRFARSYLGVSF